MLRFRLANSRVGIDHCTKRGGTRTVEEFAGSAWAPTLFSFSVMGTTTTVRCGGQTTARTRVLAGRTDLRTATCRAHPPRCSAGAMAISPDRKGPVHAAAARLKCSARRPELSMAMEARSRTVCRLAKVPAELSYLTTLFVPKRSFNGRNISVSDPLLLRACGLYELEAGRNITRASSIRTRQEYYHHLHLQRFSIQILCYSACWWGPPTVWSQLWGVQAQQHARSS